MDVRSPVNIVTRYELWPRLIDDYWFTETAVFSRLRESYEPFGGGLFTKSVFRYRPLPTVAYGMGANFTLTKVPTLGESNLGIKYLITNVPEFKEELQVINKGPQATFSLLDEDLSNGLSSITNKAAISAYGDAVANPLEIDGFGAGIGDGVRPNWLGNVITSYGGATRTGVYGSVLNGNIFWGGNDDGTVAGPTFPKWNEVYNACSRGIFEPELITVNRYLHGLAMNQIEPQYRYSSMERDPYWGGSGFKFRNAIVVIDEYCPSARNGLTNAENYGLGNFKTAAFTNPVTTSVNNFPTTSTAANLTPGELAWFFTFGFNAPKPFITLRLSDNEEYGFGLTPFMQLPDSTKVNAQIKAALNMIINGGRYQGCLMGQG